jgi:hypothetical protein
MAAADRAEGGQVEPVLGRFSLTALHTFFMIVTIIKPPINPPNSPTKPARFISGIRQLKLKA